MNKNLIVVGVIIVLLLIGGGAYLMMNKSAGPAMTSTSTDSSQTAMSQNGGTSMKSLKDLMTSGIAQKCTFSDSNVSGTSYVSGGKVRSDFTTTSGGTTMTAHMIAADKISYIWTDGSAMAFKMAFDPTTATANTKGNTAAPQNFDANKAMNFQCSPGVVDGSLFTPPTTVKFTDMTTSAAPSATGATSSSGYTPPTTGNQCATCNYLTGNSKTQCLSAYKCQ